MKKLNFNSIVLAVILGGGGFACRELYQEVRKTHDAVLVIEQHLPRLVTKETFELAISEIKARQSATEARLSALDAQIQAQQRKP